MLIIIGINFSHFPSAIRQILCLFLYSVLLLPDVFDMLAVDRTALANEPGTSAGKAPKASKSKKIPKGMSRELYSIMAVDGDLPEVYSTIPSTPPVSDSWKKTVQRDKKRKARKWLMTHFSASPRPNAQKFLAHWCKAEDVDKDYPFAKLAPHCFSEPLDIPTFTSAEYSMLPSSDSSYPWTEEATRSLLDLVTRYDTRFEVMQYVWNTAQYGKRDCVDLRARFTDVYNYLVQWRNDGRPLLPNYDAASERKRRSQLDRLQMRTQEEVKQCGWSIDRLIDWLIDWGMNDQLVDRSFDGLIDLINLTGILTSVLFHIFRLMSTQCSKNKSEKFAATRRNAIGGRGWCSSAWAGSRAARRPSHLLSPARQTAVKSPWNPINRHRRH